MIRLLALLSVLFLASCSSKAQKEIHFNEKDKVIVNDIFNQLKNDRGESTANLVVKAGMQLLNTPYVAQTLEADKEELIINLRELDCTTFAENCLALARCVKKGSPSFEAFLAELREIRYRNGQIEGYPSRLHYFSDWIYENAAKHRVEMVSEKIAQTPYPLEINFMSTHPDSYPQLKSHSELIPELAATEKTINARRMYFIPKEKLSDVEELLHSGDIVGITTNISGLDITHVGILVKIDGRIHLLHASSAAEKVVLSEDTLEDYLNSGKRLTGIMVARPL